MIEKLLMKNLMIKKLREDGFIYFNKFLEASNEKTKEKFDTLIDYYYKQKDYILFKKFLYEINDDYIKYLKKIGRYKKYEKILNK